MVFLHYDKKEVICMGLKFEKLLSKLSDYDFKVYSKAWPEREYKEVRFLSSKESLIGQDILYVAKVSIVLEFSSLIEDAGLILISDSSFDNSLFKADVAVFSSDTDMNRLFNTLLDLFQSSRKLIDSSAALLNSLIRGKGLNYIVQVGSEILGNPVFLIDATSRLLASSAGTNIDDTFWNDLENLGYGNNKNLELYVREGIVEQVTQSSHPVLVSPNTPHYLKRIVGKIQVKDKTIGYIGVLENNRQLTQEDISIAQLLCDVLASEMQKDKNYYNVTGVMHEYLLLDLLNERTGNDTIVRERIEELFHGESKHFYVLFANLQGNSGASHLSAYLRWRLETMLPSCKTVFYNDGIVLLLESKTFEQWPETKEVLCDVFKQNNLSAGVSRVFNDVIEFRNHYLQAQAASKLGKVLKKGEILFDYEQLYIFDLLKSLDGQVGDFCHPSVGKVKEYDLRNGTDYFTTLYEYLLCGGNLTMTADKLYLHRNTVVHRISRIQKICGMDLAKGDNRFKLLLTYYIMELL